MVSLFYRIFRDKLLFALLIMVAIAFILDLSLVIFDIIQFIQVSKSATNLSVGFVSFNIIVLVVNVVVLIFGLVYYLLKRRVVKSK